jgi:hypothetical protein
MMLQAALTGGLLAVAMILASMAHWFGLYRLQNDYSYKESKLKNLGAIVAQVEELEKAAAAVRARLGVIEDLLTFNLKDNGGDGLHNAWNIFRQLATLLIISGFLLALLVKGVRGE